MSFKDTFTNGNLKRGGYVAVPTALITVVCTVLAQQYVLPQQHKTVNELEGRFSSHRYEDQLWRETHKEWAGEVIKRLEEKSEQQYKEIDRRLSRIEGQHEQMMEKLDRLLIRRN